jgi:drug/metabolite transporter (DMT)-like permease
MLGQPTWWVKSLVKETTRGALLVILAAVFWGTGGMLARLIFATGALGPIGVAFWRGAIASPIMLAFAFYTSRSLPRPQKGDILTVIVFGLIGYTAFQALFMTSFSYTKIAHAAALIYVAPIFVAIFSYLVLKEKITTRKMIGIGLAIIGAVLVVGLSGENAFFVSETLTGDMLAIGAGVAYSSWFIFGKMLGTKYTPVALSTLVMLIGTIALLPLVLASEPTSHFNILQVAPLILLMALVPTSAAYITYLTGLRLVEPTKASVYATVDPIASALFAYLAFRETVTIASGLGIALILFSIFTVTYKAS